MSNQLITVEKGFSIQNLYIGPFTLSKGECVAIDFPAPLDLPIRDTLFRILTGDLADPTVRLSARFVSVKVEVSKPFVSLFKRITAKKFLVRNPEYSTDSADRFLKANSIEPDVDINSLGHNDRLLLALEVAYSKCKNIVISTSGLDYTGIENIRNRILPEIEHGAVIEITYPDSHGRTRLFDNSSVFQGVETVVENT